MEPWLKYLLEWAVPVLNGIISAKISEIWGEFKKQTLDNHLSKLDKFTLPPAGTSPPTLSELALEIGKEIPGFLADTVSLMHQRHEETGFLASNLVPSTRLWLQPSSDFWDWEEEKAKEQRLTVYQRETLLKIAAYQRETTLQLPEVNKILDQWPLKLLPSQILTSGENRQKVPIRIFITPLKFDIIEGKIPNMETKISQGVREFLGQHYPLHSGTRATEFLGGAWENKRFHGEASIKALFGMLKSEPCMILESEVAGDSVIFRVAYWGVGQSHYFYQTILNFSYREFLQSAAHERSAQWRTTRDKLLALGKTMADVERLGGDQAINLAILEEAEALAAAGIDVGELQLEYRVTPKDWEELCQFLIASHCLVAGWLVDMHYLIYEDVPPLLPELLPDLMVNLGYQRLLSQTIATSLSIYQEIFQAMAMTRPAWAPELALKIAMSLIHLPDKSWAQAQVNYSFNCWLHLHQLPPVGAIRESPLQGCRIQLVGSDVAYLESLKSCLVAIGDDAGVAIIMDLMATVTTATPPSQGIGSQVHPNFTHLRTYNSLTPVAALALSAGGDTLFSCGDGSTIKFWDVTDPGTIPIATLTGHSGGVVTLTLSGDGRILASSDKSKHRSYIKIWDWQAGKLLWTLFGHKKQIHALALTPDGKILASGSHKIKLWNLETGESFRTLFGHKKWVYSLAIAPDGKTLVSGSEDTTVKVWDITTVQLRRTLVGHQSSVRSVAITPDGETIISGSDDGTVKVWDLATGKLLHTFTDNGAAVFAVAATDWGWVGGDICIAGGEDKTLKIWDLHNGDLVQTLALHNDVVRAVAVTTISNRPTQMSVPPFPAQVLLASGSDDGIIHVSVLSH
ncbi:MAG: hypothetical protein Fur0025_45870 [Oscillatoriaceae cyanobacterium]